MGGEESNRLSECSPQGWYPADSDKEGHIPEMGDGRIWGWLPSSRH